MYSVVGKKDGMIHFLADSDADLITITDSCKPGSYVEVLEKGNIHVFVKSPSGLWVLVKGTSTLEIPKNDAKVFVPNPNEYFQGDTTRTIGEYQKNIKIYNNGLVTGTLFENTVSENSGYPINERTGHYVTVNLETPEGAEHYSIYTEGQKRKEVECDGVLSVRMENMTEGKKIKIVYDDEASKEFEFDLGSLTLV